MSALANSLKKSMAEEEKRAAGLLKLQADSGAPQGSAGWTQFQNQIDECGLRCAKLKDAIATLEAP